MSSTAEHEMVTAGTTRAGSEGRTGAPASGERIVVHQNAHGFSLEYRDPNPETRYLPPEQTTWEKLKEMWRLGGKSASAFRIP